MGAPREILAGGMRISGTELHTGLAWLLKNKNMTRHGQPIISHKL